MPHTERGVRGVESYTYYVLHLQFEDGVISCCHTSFIEVDPFAYAHDGVRLKMDDTFYDVTSRT